MRADPQEYGGREDEMERQVVFTQCESCGPSRFIVIPQDFDGPSREIVCDQCGTAREVSTRFVEREAV